MIDEEYSNKITCIDRKAIHRQDLLALYQRWFEGQPSHGYMHAHFSPNNDWAPSGSTEKTKAEKKRAGHPTSYVDGQI